MTTLKLGDFLDGETLDNENKAVHLLNESLSNISDDIVDQIYQSGIWNIEFSEIVDSNVLDFISNIIPKYITCFTNANINGILNIGVDDTNERKGIPTLNKIPKEKIMECIKESLEKNVSTKLDIDELMSKISLEYILLDIDETILSDDACRYYEQFSKHIITYNNEMDEYLEQHALFLIEHRKYTQKLEKMLNITKYRLELVDFIKSECEDLTICKNIINKLEGNDFIKLQQDNILYDRVNKSRIFYWIAKFRDKKGKEILALKPLKPLHPSIYYPRQIIANLPVMRHRFIKKNSNLKYYMIKINFETAGINEKLRYYDRYSKKWLYRTRIDCKNIKDGPGCI